MVDIVALVVGKVVVVDVVVIVVVGSEVVVVVECMCMHTTFGKWCEEACG